MVHDSHECVAGPTLDLKAGAERRRSPATGFNDEGPPASLHLWRGANIGCARKQFDAPLLAIEMHGDRAGRGQIDMTAIIQGEGAICEMPVRWSARRYVTGSPTHAKPIIRAKAAQAVIAPGNAQRRRSEAMGRDAMVVDGMLCLASVPGFSASCPICPQARCAMPNALALDGDARSEERRVGKECFSTCSSRG